MANEASNLLAEGTLYVNQKIDGAYTGWKKWPGLNSLMYKLKAKTKEANTKDKGKYLQTTASLSLPESPDLTLQINQVSGVMLGAALQGTVADLSEGAGSVLDEVAVAQKGGYIKLAHRNIKTAGFVVTDSTGVTTYAKDTDYTVNYVAGLLYIVPGGTIPDAASIKIDYDHMAVTGQRVKANTKPQVIGQLFLDGRNLVDGKHMTVLIHEASITSETGFDPMSDDFVTLALSGKAITPEGFDSPYELDINLDFAA